MSEKQIVDESNGPERIDCAHLRVWRTPDGEYRAEIGADQSLRDVRFVCAFPRSVPDAFIEVRDGSGNRLGMIEHLNLLGDEVRGVVEEALRERYVVPVIEEVMEITEDRKTMRWAVRTDRGPTRFTVLYPQDNLRPDSEGRLHIQDGDGNRYLLPDPQAVDESIRRQFAHLL
jgi:hypothetical protein